MMKIKDQEVMKYFCDKETHESEDQDTWKLLGNINSSLYLFL